ncbi:hypothetical protein P154DRAFT_524566 [Amniculicola lignicola CBS 123094]|uniref:GAR domain-containing protein n=1 Tax=Amniculicola lignicola CBS 123094 TaxID=1392246 RepID=A0A6A5W6X6_9PLEO|nr:hypothetical protein P154DRAFT_524566 [Amniculicola lignicola CBS 123094]
MSGLSSPPPRFLPPISPYHRPSSPTSMSPGTRRGRTAGSSEEGHLRDLSPSTTLRAFTEKPIPFDTARDEYKIFACIESLTPAEKDLGARVARAAQRLKSWCAEIEQWGWTGTFEPPSADFREKRRRSLEMRIREHVRGDDAAETIGPLEYWGSLLSVEVEAHEIRLDEMSDELLALDVEELKQHFLGIHNVNKSRPSSAGYEATRQSYTPMGDFNILITQTLVSALPHHSKFKDGLSTWTARVSVLREAPRFLADLGTSQKAMQLGWDALEPPTDFSDAAFDKWNDAVETISGVLQEKVSDLGRRLDGLLDTLEEHEDCIPDHWIDTFEKVEADYGRWAHDSRRRVIEFDVQRRTEKQDDVAKTRESSETLALHSGPGDTTTEGPQQTVAAPEPQVPKVVEDATRSVTAFKSDIPAPENVPATHAQTYQTKPLAEEEDVDDDSIFEEGDTVIHNEPEETEGDLVLDSMHNGSASTSFSDTPIIVSPDESNELAERPRTPASRRGSVDSISSNISLTSSPPGPGDESPSLRSGFNRPARAPRPALNAAMSKRRPAKNGKDLSADIDSTPPWPPSQFSAQDSAADLERKISDILTTIPAHIRLTSHKDADNRAAKRNLANKSSKGYLRATRSISGMKSPELTLSPAKQNFDSANGPSGRKSAAAQRGENDIQLYHLTQPGKEHPIKLFIRRVGENGERVMVRVGGGWADLGEYLRQYAEHHGRRTVSEGKFEILGLEVKNPESPRPESAMSKRDRRCSGGASITSSNTTPQKKQDDSIPPVPPIPNLIGTPNGLTNNASTPSTTSSRHSWTGNEVGLSGPNSRKLDLSNEKKEWVDGMMEQAKRSVSGTMLTSKKSEHALGNQNMDRAESRSESRSQSRAGGRKPEFGDLGKIGGTKRVFLRGGGVSEH